MVNEWKQIAYKKLDADADTITLGDTTAKAEDWSDDFSTDNGTQEGTLINVTGGVIDGQYDRDTTNEAWWDDPLGTALSDTAWKIRFKLSLSNMTTTTGVGCVMSIGMSSVSGATSGSEETGDHMTLRLQNSTGTNSYMEVCALNNEIIRGGSGVDIGTVESDVDGTHWIELIRINDTLRCNVYTDSNYTNLNATQSQTVSGITGLRYFRFQNMTQAVSTFDGSGDIDIDDLQIWNGTNTVVEGGFEPHDMMKLVVYAEPSGGTLGLRGYVNEDLGGSKSSRYSQNGASDVTTGTEQSTFDWIPSVAENNRFLESIILDFPNQEKLFINHSLRDGGLGSGVAPTRLESVVKYENQVDRLISITIINSAGAGDMKKGSYAILYGAQRPTITHANGNTLVEVQGDTI